MIVANYLSMKELSISLTYNVHNRKDLGEPKSLEDELNGERSGDSRAPSRFRLTDLSIKLSDKDYRINLEPTYCILRILCDILHGPAKAATRFTFGFCASAQGRFWNGATRVLPDITTRIFPILTKPRLRYKTWDMKDCIYYMAPI